MHRLVIVGAALLSITAAAPTLADDATTVGTTAGAASGATAGFFIAGPIGAIVGGVVGATVGAGVSGAAEDYATSHREASITFDGDVRPGYRVGRGLHMYPVPTDNHYSYVYVNDHPVLIDNATGTVVWVGN